MIVNCDSILESFQMNVFQSFKFSISDLDLILAYTLIVSFLHVNGCFTKLKIFDFRSRFNCF